MKSVALLPLLWSLSCAVVTEDILQEEDWSFQTYLGDNITFHCNDSQIGLRDHAIVQWVLPNGEVLSSPYISEKHEVSDSDNITGNLLKIVDTREEDKGLYLCCVKGAEAWCKQHTIRGLNIVNHKIHDLFERYEHNLIVAVIAALVLFVPLVAICLIYKYRYLTEEDKEKNKMKKMGMKADRYHYDDDMQYNSTSADKVKSAEGHGSYDNPGVETRL